MDILPAKLVCCVVYRKIYRWQNGRIDGPRGIN